MLVLWIFKPDNILINTFNFCVFAGFAGSQPCRIAFPMTTQYISAYYDTIIQGKGCSSNATTNSTAEVHVINLLNAGPVFRNDLAEVNLLIKSRNEERGEQQCFWIVVLCVILVCGNGEAMHVMHVMHIAQMHQGAEVLLVAR